MKYTIILLLVLLILSKEDDNLKIKFSLNTFLNYIQQIGFYNLFNEVKCALGDDVSIELCKEFCESPYCEEVVRVYMTCGDDKRRRSRGSENRSADEILISILEKYKDIIEKYRLFKNTKKLKLRLKPIDKFIIIDGNRKDIEIRKF